MTVQQPAQPPFGQSGSGALEIQGNQAPQSLKAGALNRHSAVNKGKNTVKSIHPTINPISEQMIEHGRSVSKINLSLPSPDQGSGRQNNAPPFVDKPGDDREGESQVREDSPGSVVGRRSPVDDQPEHGEPEVVEGAASKDRRHRQSPCITMQPKVRNIRLQDVAKQAQTPRQGKSYKPQQEDNDAEEDAGQDSSLAQYNDNEMTNLLRQSK